MKELGITRIASEDMSIVVEYQNRPIRLTIYKIDISKTTKTLEKTLRSHSLDNVIIQETILIISQGWNNIVGNNSDQIIKEEGAGVLKEIEELRRNKISQDEWRTKLLDKHQALFNVTNKNIPNLWPILEFSLSIKSFSKLRQGFIPEDK